MRSVIIISVLILYSLPLISDAYKILVYNPRFGPSHVSFMGKIADTLADAGHDVVVYQPIFEKSLTKNGSSNPNIRFLINKGNFNAPEIADRQDGIWKDDTIGKMVEASYIEIIALTKYRFRWFRNFWILGRNIVNL